MAHSHAISPRRHEESMRPQRSGTDGQGTSCVQVIETRAVAVNALPPNKALQLSLVVRRHWRLFDELRLTK